MTKFDIKKYKSLSVLFWNNMQKTSSKIHYVNFCYMQFIHGGMSRKFMHTTIHYFGGRGEKSALWFKIACWRRPKIDEYLVISIDFQSMHAFRSRINNHHIRFIYIYVRPKSGSSPQNIVRIQPQNKGACMSQKVLVSW